MPAYEWSKKHNAFVKSCSHCKKVFVGAQDNAASVKIFTTYFHVALGRDGGDKFDPQCRKCKSLRSRLSKYGLNIYDEIIRQNGKCGICKKQFEDMHRGMNVDHDHDTRVFRQLLCYSCNLGMRFVDDEEWLKKAVAYRKRYR